MDDKQAVAGGTGDVVGREATGRIDGANCHVDACLSLSCPCYIDGRRSAGDPLKGVKLVKLPPPDDDFEECAYGCNSWECPHAAARVRRRPPMGDAFHRFKANTHVERAYQELTSAVIELTEAGDHASADLLRSARDVTDAIAKQAVAAPASTEEDDRG